MTEEKKSLKETIQHLSQKKEQVLSTEALQAKEKLDQERAFFPNTTQAKKFHKHITIVEEFSNSITLLNTIFKKSKFDELALLISHPSRLFCLNFFVSVIRGIGFAIGFLLILIIFGKCLLNDLLLPSMLELLIQAIPIN